MELVWLCQSDWCHRIVITSLWLPQQKSWGWGVTQRHSLSSSATIRQPERNYHTFWRNCFKHFAMKWDILKNKYNMDTRDLLRSTLFANPVLSASTRVSFCRRHPATLNSASSLFQKYQKMELCTHVPVCAYVLKRGTQSEKTLLICNFSSLQTSCECKDGENTDSVKIILEPWHQATFSHWDGYHRSPSAPRSGMRTPVSPLVADMSLGLGAYFVHVDLLLVSLLLLQELLVLLLNDQLSQRALRQRSRLGSIQGSVTG